MAQVADRRLLGIGAVLLWITAATAAVKTDRINDNAQILIVGGAVTLTILWYLTRRTTPAAQLRDYGNAMFHLGQLTNATSPDPDAEEAELVDQPPAELLHALRSPAQDTRAVKLTIGGIVVIAGVHGGTVHAPEEEAAAWRSIRHAAAYGQRQRFNVMIPRQEFADLGPSVDYLLRLDDGRPVLIISTRVSLAERRYAAQQALRTYRRMRRLRLLTIPTSLLIGDALRRLLTVKRHILTAATLMTTTAAIAMVFNVPVGGHHHKPAITPPHVIPAVPISPTSDTPKPTAPANDSTHQPASPRSTTPPKLTPVPTTATAPTPAPTDPPISVVPPSTEPTAPESPPPPLPSSSPSPAR